MTVQYDEAVSAAAKTVHDKVWALHWKEGHTTLKPERIIDYVRDIRLAAGYAESKLPDDLLVLLKKAREMAENKKADQVIKLAELIIPLKQIMPAAA